MTTDQANELIHSSVRGTISVIRWRDDTPPPGVQVLAALKCPKRQRVIYRIGACDDRGWFQPFPTITAAQQSPGLAILRWAPLTELNPLRKTTRTRKDAQPCSA